MSKPYIIIEESPETWANLLPLTLTRPVGDLRTGIHTNAARWASLLGAAYGWRTAAPYLRELFPPGNEEEATLCVDGSVIATPALARQVASLAPGEQLLDPSGTVVAHRGQGSCTKTLDKEPLRIRHLYDLFLLAGEAICLDVDNMAPFERQIPSATNTIVGDPSQVFIAEDAEVECAVLNVKNGPIYIAPGAEVMEGSLIRGPFALCEGAHVNMGTKIYGPTVVGPHCKVGGEINNVVFQGYSNKAHDGFLGNAVIGQWCNLGAGAVASNLKNNYQPIKLWNYPAQRFLPTGLQFCGLVMGDHSKAGINTMFNTATVLGVAVNVHSTGFPRNFVPSFSDGGAVGGFSEMSLGVFLDTARRVMARRGVAISEADERMYAAIKDGEFRDLL